MRCLQSLSLIFLIRFLFPALFTDQEMRDMFLVSHIEFYELRDKYVRPFLATAGPNGGRRYKCDLTSVKN